MPRFKFLRAAAASIHPSNLMVLPVPKLDTSKITASGCGAHGPEGHPIPWTIDQSTPGLGYKWSIPAPGENNGPPNKHDNARRSIVAGARKEIRPSGRYPSDGYPGAGRSPEPALDRKRQ